jgi:hypothetical protein
LHEVEVWQKIVLWKFRGDHFDGLTATTAVKSLC